MFLFFFFSCFMFSKLVCGSLVLYLLWFWKILDFYFFNYLSFVLSFCYSTPITHILQFLKISHVNPMLYSGFFFFFYTFFSLHFGLEHFYWSFFMFTEFSCVTFTDEPIKGILHLCHCIFLLLEVPFDSFHLSAYIIHMYFHCIYLFH